MFCKALAEQIGERGLGSNALVPGIAPGLMAQVQAPYRVFYHIGYHLLEAKGFLKNRDSTYSIQFFFWLFGSESVRQPRRRARIERWIIPGDT